ncbi:MAG TPA: acyl-CoA dehydrogenase family protein [Acidimicrobiales bacterium]|nr:acyl-CoA dehydrogenase family protein [Acidimicrobiales bacterium]
MDFTLSDEQQAIAELSHRILSEQLPPERLRELEQDPRWYARDVWAELAKADLLGIALPEADGGGGYGLLEACLVAEQVGRTVAPLPYLSCIVGGALPLARFGTQAQRARFLPGVIDGSVTLTVALHERDEVETPVLPTTVGAQDPAGWRLDGEKVLVPGAEQAAAILVPARTGDERVTVFLVAPDAPGVTLAPEVAVSGEPQATVHLDGVVVAADDVLGEVDGGQQVVQWVRDRMLAAICATQTGVCEEALAITSRYVCEREQFGTKLGTFQAVGHRIADAYIDTEAIRLTALQAVWRLDRDLPAAEELMVAKFWAAEGGQRVVHAAQHLHGGIGVDLDYPIHRYFRWAKVLELTLGGATPSLLRLGARLASQPVGLR